jgi:hypothetical protein
MSEAPTARRQGYVSGCCWVIRTELTWPRVRIDGAYYGTYLESFERVWGSARPLGDEEPGDSAT